MRWGEPNECTCIRNKRMIVERGEGGEAYASIGSTYLRKLSAGATRLRPRALFKLCKNFFLETWKLAPLYSLSLSLFIISASYYLFPFSRKRGDNAERWTFEEALKSAFWRVVLLRDSTGPPYCGELRGCCLVVFLLLHRSIRCRFVPALCSLHSRLFIYLSFRVYVYRMSLVNGLDFVNLLDGKERKRGKF